MAIDLSGRIKHEAAKGVFQAIMKDCGYRVIGLGMETVIREVTPLTDSEYQALGLPVLVRRLPDFLVIDKDMKRRQLVEVKYSADIDARVVGKIADRAKRWGQLTLVMFNGGQGQVGMQQNLGEIVKCCELRRAGKGAEALLKTGQSGMQWQTLHGKIAGGLWDGMSPLSALFNLKPVDAKLERAVEQVFRVLAA